MRVCYTSPLTKMRTSSHISEIYTSWQMCCLKKKQESQIFAAYALQWRHNECDGVSNHQPHDCLLNHRWKKTSKLRVTGLCEGNSPVTGEFPAQKASNAGKIHLMTSSCVNCWRTKSISCIRFTRYSKSGQNGTWGQNGTPGVLEKPCQAWVYFQVHLISVIGQFSVMHGNQTCNRPRF